MVNFYLLGDMGTGGNDQKKVSKALWKHMKNNKNRKNTFVCGLGDNIYEEGCFSEDDIQFRDKFEKPYSNIPNSIKFYMCLGNHDYGLDTISIGNSIYQLYYAKKSKENGKKWIMLSNYYPFKKGTKAYKLWKKYYSGASGLMGLKIKSKNINSVRKFVNSLKLFGYGYSWGGFESLVLHQEFRETGNRKYLNLAKDEHLVRLHIGLEDPKDLIADIKQALRHLK